MRHAVATPDKPARSVLRAAQRDRVRRFRERMKAMGMRRISLWVPDVASPAIRAEARRESLLLAQSPHEAQTMDFLDALNDAADWEE